MPYKCPVCDGRGIVPGGFYLSTGQSWAFNKSYEPCRSCHGTGVVWDVENVMRRSNIDKFAVPIEY